MMSTTRSLTDHEMIFTFGCKWQDVFNYWGTLIKLERSRANIQHDSFCRVVHSYPFLLVPAVDITIDGI